MRTILTKIILAGAALFIFAGAANAQCTGVPPTNQVCAGSASGSPLAPKFRALVADDIPIQLNATGMLGKLTTFPSSSSGAGLNLPQGAAPSAPANGDLWTTTVGLFGRINGVTVGPYIGVTLPVVANNTACFADTIGTVKDCGVSPNTITIGSTIVTGGTNKQLLYNNGGILGQTPALSFGWDTPEAHGAAGNGSTDDTTAVQAAFDSCKNVWMGQDYKITGSITYGTCGGGSTIEGTGNNNLVVAGNFPAIVLNPDSSSSAGIYYLTIENLGCVKGAVGTNTSEACIKITGSTKTVNYSRFSNIRSGGLYRGLYSDNSAGVGEWNLFTGWYTYTSTADPHDAFYFATAAGGSSVYSNNILGATQNCFAAGDGGVTSASNVGDMIISNNQFNSCVNGVNLLGGSLYGTNVQLTGNDWDAGVTHALVLNNMGNVTATRNNWGGAVDISITNSRGIGTTQSPAIYIDRYIPLVAGLTTNQNNWNPTGFTTAGRLVLTANGNHTITGLSAMPEDRVLEIYNASASVITLADNSASSTSTNRFDFGGTDFQLPSGATTFIYYNTSLQLWQSKALSNQAVTYNRIQNVGALSLIGRSVNSSGVAGEIQCGGDGNIFRRASGTLGCGTIDLSASNAVGSSVLAAANGGTGITSLGTGVATALGVNVGTAGAFVVNGGALGSPSSAGTIPAFTLGGTISGGGNPINNVIIGASTPLAGTFTSLTAVSEAVNCTTGIACVVVTGPASQSVTLDIVCGASCLNGAYVRQTTAGGTMEFETDTSGNWLLNTNGIAAGVLKLTRLNSAANTLQLTKGGIAVGGDVGTGITTGEIAQAKVSASGLAPGAGFAKLSWVAGTTSGTCKLISYAGTSTTPVTIVDNVGGSC